MAEEFALQLKAFAEKATANVNTVVRRISLDVLSHVVLRTPVGNRELWAVNIERKAKGLPGLVPKGYVGGRLRANWNVSLAAPDESTSEVKDKTGASTIARGSAAIDGYTGEDIYMTNGLPYAIPIEYGSSKQAPAGMVRVTVAEFQTFVNTAAASVQK